jgi:hypothetical protein
VITIRRDEPMRSTTRMCDRRDKLAAAALAVIDRTHARESRGEDRV